MDSFDRAILALVQKDNQRTHAEIAKAVNLSPSSVRRRLARLREDQIIESDVSILSATAQRITVIVLVAFQNEVLDEVRAFKKRMQEADEVSQCYSVAGQIDFVLVGHQRCRLIKLPYLH